MFPEIVRFPRHLFDQLRLRRSGGIWHDCLCVGTTVVVVYLVCAPLRDSVQPFFTPAGEFSTQDILPLRVTFNESGKRCATVRKAGRAMVLKRGFDEHTVCRATCMPWAPSSNTEPAQIVNQRAALGRLAQYYCN